MQTHAETFKACNEVKEMKLQENMSINDDAFDGEQDKKNTS